MRIIIIYGPTASGKSALALELATQHNGIIINADSMQIYDALPILTAQPDATERAQAPRRLYAHLPPSAKCSAAAWRDLATAEIESAMARGQTPIIVGGTGFYIKTLMKGLSPMPAVPDDIRATVTSLQQDTGNPGFHALLAAKDPVMAERLNPNDTQRLIRAYEVLEATGESLSHWQSLPAQGPPPHWDFETHFVNPDRETLYDRCNRRFDIMLDRGILDEIKDLLSLIETGSVPADAPITHALGFHPFTRYLRDECALEKAIEQSKQETRNYAKRQLTWFRNQMPPA